MKLDLYSTRYSPELGIYTEESAVGNIYGHYRLTESGVTDDSSGWWYFLRKYEDKEHPYWYKKIRKPATDKSPEGEVVEEYVGLTLPFSIPREWLIKLRRKAMDSV